MSIHRNARVVSMIAVLMALLTATAAFAEEGAFDDPPAEPTCEEVIVHDGGSTDEGPTRLLPALPHVARAPAPVDAPRPWVAGRRFPPPP